MKTTVKKSLCLLTAVFLSVTAGFGQIRIDWQQCYGSSGYDGGYGIQSLGDGYRVLSSTSERDGMCHCGSYHGVWLFDLNPDLSIRLQQCKEYSIPSKLVRNESGETFSIGVAYTYDKKLFVDKLDEAGIAAWSVLVGPTSGDATALTNSHATATDDGGVAALFPISAASGDVTVHYGGYDCWVVKLDTEGQLEWERTFGNEGDDTPRCIVKARDGGLIVGMTSAQTGNGNVGCGQPENSSVLVKLDAGGNVEWDLCLPSVEFADLLELEEGYLLAGTLRHTADPEANCGDGIYTRDCAMMRCDDEGNVLWFKEYGGSCNESLVRVFGDGEYGFTVFANTKSNDGDVASAASLGVTDAEQGNVWVFHVDAQGGLVWERCIGSSKGLLEQVSDVARSDDGSFTLVGEMTWFAEESSGDVCCSNNALLPNSLTNIWVLHLTDVYDHTEVRDTAEEGITMLPNPTSRYVTITGESLRRVEIHNVLGQKVATVNADSNEVTIDLSGLPQGVYLVETTLADGRQATGKLLVR